MRLTTKGRYALSAMLDLALHPEVGPISLAVLSQRQRIPLPYLEQLANRLKQNGLLQSIRGVKGGYILGRSAENITIADVLMAADETLDVTHCGGTHTCYSGQKCLTHAIWAELTHEILKFLSSKTLATLAQRPDIQAIALRQDKTFQLAVEVV